VLDGKLKRVRRASVIIEGKELRSKLATNRAGEFGIALPPGVYQITVEKAGYKKFIMLEVAVEPNTRCSFTFHLENSIPNDVITH
jgi:hypothetical protein